MQLIDGSALSPALKSELHDLRGYRNNWVHVADPWDESNMDMVERPEIAQAEIEPWALRAVTALRHLFYWDQGT